MINCLGTMGDACSWFSECSPHMTHFHPSRTVPWLKVLSCAFCWITIKQAICSELINKSAQQKYFNQLMLMHPYQDSFINVCEWTINNTNGFFLLFTIMIWLFEMLITLFLKYFSNVNNYWGRIIIQEIWVFKCNSMWNENHSCKKTKNKKANTSRQINKNKEIWNLKKKIDLKLCHKYKLHYMIIRKGCHRGSESVGWCVWLPLYTIVYYSIVYYSII